VGARNKVPSTPPEGWRSVLSGSPSKGLGLESNIPYLYAVDEMGNLMVAPRGHPVTGQKHTQLTAGGRVRAAGELLQTETGKIRLNNKTGRYVRQDATATERVQQAIESLGV
jgi:hypothetical protein